MNKLLLLSIIVLTLASMSYATGADWTLMVYLDADSNLHYAGLDDINEMEWCDVPSNGSVKIIVLFDGQYSGDSKIYDIQHDTNGYDSTIISTVVDDGNAVVPANNECDMSSPAQFDKFVDWAQANYPANKYLLSIWNHGDGIFKGEEQPQMFKGVCGGLQLWEIDDVLETTVDPIDIVGFDVCLLGQIETGWQLSENVDYVIASEELEPGDGWEYTAFDKVCDDPSTTPVELIDEIVNLYFSYTYGDTQAGQDLTVLRGNLSTKLDAFCTELIAAAYEHKSDMSSARSNAWYSSYNPNCRDLYEFAEAIKNDGDLPTSLRDSASEFCDEWENFIVAGGLHHSSDDASGATVYFPTNAPNSADWNTYTTDITFTDGTLWDEFLIEYADPSTSIKSSSLGGIKATYR